MGINLAKLKKKKLFEFLMQQKITGKDDKDAKFVNLKDVYRVEITYEGFND